MATIETERLIIRSWTLDDVPALAKHANNPRIARNLRDAFPHPYSEEDAVFFIREIAMAHPDEILAITYNEEAIGGVGALPGTDISRLNCEIGYWLAEPFWGQGLTTEAVSAFCEYLFEHYPFIRIFATPFGSNKASQALLLKCGFVLEAVFKQNLIKDGELEDEMVFALRRVHGG